MKVFFFVKDSANNCQLRGGIDISLPVPTADEMSQLVAEQDLCTSAGLVPCEASEYEAQLVNGAVSSTETSEAESSADTTAAAGSETAAAAGSETAAAAGTDTAAAGTGEAAAAASAT